MSLDRSIGSFVKNTSKDIVDTFDDIQDSGISVIDGVITHGGVATATVVNTLVKGGVDTAVGITEVGSNILGSLGEGFGGALNDFASALGLPTPGQAISGMTNLLLLGGLAIVAIIVFSRRSGPASPPPPTANLGLPPI